MTAVVALIDLAGSIALLLWGTHMVQTGIQRAFGSSLRASLGRALKNRVRAFLAGIGVTAILQSSTATGLMTASFAASGLVDLVPALAVMLGANVGTTLIVQVLSFDVVLISPALILIGMLMFRRDSRTRAHDLGRVFIGLGLMLLALRQLLDLMTSHENSPVLGVVFTAVSASWILDVCFAAILTWAAHSSVAIVLLITSLATKGVVPLDSAFALVLGANLGTAINPLIEGPHTNDPAAKRLPFGNLIGRLLGITAAIGFLGPISQFMASVEPTSARAVADFHTLFNLIVAAVSLPLLTPYARLLRFWLPDRVDPADPARPLYLDPAAKETPIVALGAASREALRLADVLDEMLQGVNAGLTKEDRRLLVETRRREDVLDKLNTAIKAYLTSIDPDGLNDSDQRRLNEILTFTMNIEQAGDVVDQNFLPHASKRLKRGLVFSEDEKKALNEMIVRLSTNLKTAASLFVTEDQRTARMLVEEKAAFRDAEAKATASHFDRLRTNDLQAAQASSIHLDLLRDIKQINSHIIAAAAYPVLERTGALRPSRVS
ncbi:phosphate:Na+ symporter [Nitrobacteraceae bacterium AZCC 1564]